MQIKDYCKGDQYVNLPKLLTSDLY